MQMVVGLRGGFISLTHSGAYTVQFKFELRIICDFLCSKMTVFPVSDLIFYFSK